ncbi:MAB_1171c family putative transporter [Streptomyces sp. NPDC018019]|uniref:MAB_1171c family putative transporter n=1 Tax=Streptomyces sp. NPDC018019 TaxID=3365030 RepID=UPI0037911314
MSDPGSFAVLLLLFGALMYVLAAVKLRAWRRHRIPGVLVMGLAAAASGTSFVLAALFSSRPLSRATGIGHLENLLANLCTMLFSAYVIVLVLLWVPPSPGRPSPFSRPWRSAWPAVRRRVVAVYGLVIPAMAVLFALASPLNASPGTYTQFESAFADRPAFVAYQAVFQGGFLWALWSLGWISWQRAGSLPASHGAARRGLRRLAIGCAIDSGYCLCTLLVVITIAAGSHALDVLSTVVGPACVIVGSLVMAVGWAGTAIATWRRRRSDYQALQPLWRACLQADHRLVLDEAHKQAPLLSARDLEWRLARRTMEIRDGQLVLNPWVGQQVITAAAQHADRAGLTGGERDAMIAATAFAAALRARQNRQRPEETAAFPGTLIPPAAERDHLVAMARYLHSPVVRRVLAETS